MHSHEAIFCQKVNSPIIYKNLDATKTITRPPSRALSHLYSKNTTRCPTREGVPHDPNRLRINDIDTYEVNSASEDLNKVAKSKNNQNDQQKSTTVDVLNRESFFCGNIDTVNERLVDLANIGRCDLYKRKPPRVYNNLEELQDSLMELVKDDDLTYNRSCFVGASNPYMNRNSLFDPNGNLATGHGSGRRTTFDINPDLRSRKDNLKDRDSKFTNSKQKSANQDLKMLALMVTPSLNQISQGKIEIPFKLDLNEIINKLDDIDGLTYLSYCKKQLMKSKNLITDIFWYIFLEKFYKNTKNRNSFSKNEITKCKEELLLNIAEKFVNLLCESEQKNTPHSYYHVSSFSTVRNTFMTQRHVQFFKQLPTILSLVVYSTFCHCWKDSWNNFVDPEFRQYIMDTLSIWIEGIRRVPGQGEHDAFWRRVEPFLLRQDKSRSDKHQQTTSVKTVAEYLNTTLGNDSLNGNAEKSKWEKGFARVSLMNRLGGNLNRRHTSRRHTVKNANKTFSEIKQHIINKDQKAMQFESSRFNLNGRSPLFALHVDRNFGPIVGQGNKKEECLVSRRSCVEKKYWKENPLAGANEGLKRAKSCANKAKEFCGRGYRY